MGGLGFFEPRGSVWRTSIPRSNGYLRTTLFSMSGSCYGRIFIGMEKRSRKGWC